MLAMLSWKSLWDYQAQVGNKWLNIQCPTEENVGKTPLCNSPTDHHDTKQEKRRGQKQNFKEDLHEKDQQEKS